MILCLQAKRGKWNVGSCFSSVRDVSVPDSEKSAILRCGQHAQQNDISITILAVLTGGES